MTDPRWLNEREQAAWRSLMVMQDGLWDLIDRRLRTRDGLSHPDYQVLAHLSESAGHRLRPFELGALLRWEKSRLSQHLTRMEKRGLVSRTRCATDQRGLVITVTDAGLAAIRAAAPNHVADVRDAFIDHLTADELQTLTTIGDKIRRRLADLETPAEPG